MSPHSHRVCSVGSCTVLATVALFFAACAGSSGSDAAAAADGTTADTGVSVVVIDPGGPDADVATDSASDGVSCTPNEPMCVSPTVSALCNGSGDDHGAEGACAAGTVCNYVTGLCGQSACEPGSRLCADEAAWVECHETGTGWGLDPQPCPTPMVCSGGLCVPCAPGSTRCDGSDHHETCADDGGGFLAPVPCPADSACASAVDACIPTSCQPGATYCVSAETVAACFSTGVSFEFAFNDCPAGEICHEGACMVCVPGSQVCDGPVAFLTCVDDGSGYGGSSACDDGTWCAPDSGLCEPGVCEEGDIQCIDEVLFRSCDADAHQWDVGLASCPAGTWCVEGACKVCDQGYAFCNTDGIRHVCVADGYLPDPCPVAFDCKNPDGNCSLQGSFCAKTKVDCVDFVTVDKCGPSGDQWLGPSSICAEGLRCSFGSCIAPECLFPVLLLVDRSGSMWDKWAGVTTSLLGLVDGNRVFGYGIELLPPSGLVDPVPVGQLNSFTGLLDVLTGDPPFGGTPLLTALSGVAGALDTHFGGQPGAVIVLTDGEPTDCFAGFDCESRLKKEVLALKEADVATYVVGFQFGDDTQLLDVMALTGSGAPHYSADDTTELLAALVAIAGELAICDEPEPEP